MDLADFGADLRVDLMDLIDLGTDLGDLGGGFGEFGGGFCQERYCQERRPRV